MTLTQDQPDLSQPVEVYVCAAVIREHFFLFCTNAAHTIIALLVGLADVLIEFKRSKIVVGQSVAWLDNMISVVQDSLSDGAV